MTSPSSWARFVVEVANTANTNSIARKTGINQSTIYRWLNDDTEPKPAQAARFAQAYDKNVLSAFIAAGWLTPEQAGTAPAPPPLRAEYLSSRELLRELDARLDPLFDDGRPTAEDLDAAHADFQLDELRGETFQRQVSAHERVADWLGASRDDPSTEGRRRQDMQQLEDQAARDEGPES